MFHNEKHSSPQTSQVDSPDDSEKDSKAVSRAEEARLLRKLQTEGSTEDAPCYVTKEWWSKWCRYTDFENEDSDLDGLETERPGPVESASSDSEMEGTTTSIQGVEISRAMWNQLVDWYSEAREEEEEPTSSETKKTLKLKLFILKRINRKLLILNCTETDEISDVFSKAATDLGFNQCRSYLFDPVDKRSFFQSDTRTLLEIGFADNTVLCVLPTIGLGRKSGRVGLMNIGNTCYMNSSLQCLLHIPELMHFFLLDNYQKDINLANPDGCNGQFADVFCRLMKRIWDGETDHTSPYQFWDVLSKYYILFAEKDQHDTAELAETVLDKLMEECNLAEIPKPYVREMDDNKSISDEDMAEKCWTYHKYRSKSFITDKFHGQYRILTTCPDCEFESRKFDSFTVLHLGLPPPKMRTIVFTLVEVRGNDVPRRYAVELSSKLLVKDLYQKVSKFFNHEEEDQPWNHLCFVLKRRKLIFLQLQDPIARIRYLNFQEFEVYYGGFSDYDEVLLYSYRGSQYGPASGGRKTCFVHQKLVQTYCHYPSYYGCQTSREEKQEFGYPLVLWLPEDELTQLSKKRALFQGNLGVCCVPFSLVIPRGLNVSSAVGLDILEHSLRPFKRQHVVGIQEEQEEEANKTEIYSGPAPENLDGSDDGSMGAEAHSHQSLPSMNGSFHENQNEEDRFEDQEMLDGPELGPLVPYEQQESSQDTQDPFDSLVLSTPRKDDPFRRNLLSPSFPTNTLTHPTVVVHDERCSTVAEIQASEEGEHDYHIGNLFEEENDNQTENRSFSTTNFGPRNAFGGGSSSSYHSTLNAVSYGSGPSDAYTWTEVESTPKDNETRTIVIDWDTNADQYYNLHDLEHPLVDPTAQNAEDSRRHLVESVTIYDCLDHEFSPHPSALDTDNLWKCGSCKNMVNGVKSMRLWRVPDILLIGLKRFDYCEARDRLVKLNQKVDFPLEGLDLTGYYAPIEGKEDSIYDLFGVCHHHGYGPKVGHYTSTVKSPDGKWVKFNDTWSIEADTRTIVSADAYLLFYRKRGLNFPEEADVLHEYMQKERQKNEEQAVKKYESMMLDMSQITSDDDVTMNGFQMKSSCYASSNRGDNGSSSSNEMNNENDISVQGSSSATMCLTSGGVGSGPSMSNLNDSSAFCNQGCSYEVVYGPVNRPDANLMRDDDFDNESSSNWCKQNTAENLDKWNSESRMEDWGSDSQTGAILPVYDSSLYSAFAQDSQKKKKKET